AARAAAGSSSEQAVAEAKRLVELRASAARLGYPQPWRPVPNQPGSLRPAEHGRGMAEAALERVSSLDLDPLAIDLAEVMEQAFGVDVCLTRLGQGFDGLTTSTKDSQLILAGLTPVALRQR